MAIDKNGRPWKPDKLALLGTMSDPAASDILGRNIKSVKRARYSRGISSFAAKRKIKQWCDDDLSVLDQYDDETVAKLVRVAKWNVKARRAELRLENARGPKGN